MLKLSLQQLTRCAGKKRRFPGHCSRPFGTAEYDFSKVSSDILAQREEMEVSKFSARKVFTIL